MHERNGLRRCWSTGFAGVLLACAASLAFAGDENSAIDAAALVGIWTVDLRPTPDAEPYFQELVVTSVDGARFEGRFYGTAVTQARINTTWGKLRIAFVTADGSGEYHHSAVLEGDKLEGLTNSTGREFLAYWSAVRSDAGPQ